MVLISGKNTVIEALKGRRKVFKIYVDERFIKDAKVSWIIEQAKSSGIPIKFFKSNDPRFQRSKIRQGVAAEVEDFSYVDFEGLLSETEKREDSLIVFLDGIEDPQNFGNIIRTSEFFGVQGIVIRKKRSVQVTPVVERISQGASSNVMIARVSNIARAIEKARKAGFFIIGLEEDSEKVLKPESFYKKTALVVGGENTGISRIVREKCDVLLKLAGMGKVGSLNAASAFAAACYCYMLRNLNDG